MAAMVVSVEGNQEQGKIETPNDIYFARLAKTIKETGGKGSMLVRGVQRDDDDEVEEEEEEDDEDDDEKDGKVYTTEQIATLRHYYQR